ncbi:MAG: bifunctional precorrin-2 dehydrogenase/sirohydrochlorin ferrochelatase [Clostridia bacterium]|nr:bifunctional precorrin-2 dehydrogenase/sirohydrochlorin ferrochelatase [Clostridia bacterium]
MLPNGLENEMYPIMLNIDGRKCVVIGGGAVALRKANKLRECGGNVVVISPEFADGFEGFTTVKKEYERRDLEGAFVVTAATNDKELNRQITADAREMKILAYAVDDAEVSDFILPASKTVGDITVAASTNGKYPYLAKRIRDEISDNIAIYNSILPYLAKERKKILASDTADKKGELKSLITDESIQELQNKIDNSFK